MTVIDLSHTMYDGLHTYKDLPPIHVCDFLSRKDSRNIYEDGTEFQIDKLSLTGNSGTYIDSPYHRFPNGMDLSELALATTVNLPGIVIRAPSSRDWMPIEPNLLYDKPLEGQAVLIETGWSKLFGTEQYFTNHPFLTAEAAKLLKQAKVTLVGIDSHNIDDTRKNSRPVHTELLGNGIPIVEHLNNLSSLPDQGFYFSAAPLKFKKVGTFPTRAYATIE